MVLLAAMLETDALVTHADTSCAATTIRFLLLLLLPDDDAGGTESKKRDSRLLERSSAPMGAQHGAV